LRIALKIDVDTFRGTREGVPALVEVLRRHGAQATFLFSLGPDHTGRALRRVFRKGFLKKVARTSVGSNYGLRTLCYGTVLPGPDIGRKCADILRGVRRAGFEAGVHCWDHVRWQDYVTRRDGAWARRELDRARSRYREVFGEAALVCGAPGWQVTPEALRLQAELGYAYCSDTRGTHPFFPVVDGAPLRCPQLPTTLPTFDELLGVDGMDENGVAERLLTLSEAPLPHGHLFTLHAELEGGRYLGMFDRLLGRWRQRGAEFLSLGDLYRRLEPAHIPSHRVVMGEISGRSGILALQGEVQPPFPER
jgi:undecaprenyl phosphate-alpha-L-ara4FN deformylase